ncbi:MAG: hypothetical protein AMXMBFR34_05800 [Myxococcaceae bacterium]
MRHPWLSLAACVLCACPAPQSQEDSGAPPPDAGPVDAGLLDAGPPRRDAGLPDAGFTQVPAASWCAARAQALCFRDVRCGRLSAGGLPDCLQREALECEQAALTRAVAEGRLQYLMGGALDCLNAYAQGSCTDEPPACATVFLGLVPPDGGCILPTECAPEGFCYLYDEQCPHRCRGWVSTGGACDGFTTRCNPSVDTCALGDAGTRVCRPFGGDDAGCASWDECASTHACVGGHCLKRNAGPGEACATTNGYPFCTGEYSCRQQPPTGGVWPPGTCQLRAGVGGTCTGPSSCLPSLRCSTVITTGACLPKAALGDNCVNYDDCEDGLYCDGRAQQCRPLPRDGGDCSSRGSFYRCAPGFSCEFSATNDDTCVGRRADGEECNYDGLCLSNECTFGTLPDGGFGGRCIAACAQRADGGF